MSARQLYPFATAIVLVSLLTACGGGGGDGGAVPPTPPPPPPPTQSGSFKDSNVSGLSFSSGSASGVTDAAGRFTCETGRPVDFSIGAVNLGSMMCTTVGSPPALVASGAFDDPEAVNIARFLQLLDGDGDPVNGISISAGLQQAADTWPQLDFAAADLDGQLVTVFSEIQSIDNRTVTAAPTAVEAFEHMDDVLACAYGGAFTGVMTGDRNGQVAFAFARRLYGFSPDEVLFLGYDPNEEFVLTTLGAYEASASQSLDTSAFDPSVLLDVRFTDADRIEGSWQFPPESVSGSIVASRYGGDTGVFRFVGEFIGDEARGVVVLRADDLGNFVGEAFNVVDGSELAISGLADQATFPLEINDGSQTFSATANLSLDAFGNTRLDGTWDDGSATGGTFRTVGCRLN